MKAVAAGFGDGCGACGRRGRADRVVEGERDGAGRFVAADDLVGLGAGYTFRAKFDDHGRRGFGDVDHIPDQDGGCGGAGTHESFVRQIRAYGFRRGLQFV